MVTTPAFYNPDDWPDKTKGGIPYRVLSRSGSAERDEETATEVYIIPANRLDEFLSESFPDPVDEGLVAIYNPRAYPGVPGDVIGATSSGFRPDTYRTRRVSWREFIPQLPIDPFSVDAIGAGHGELVEVTIEYSDAIRTQTKGDPESYIHLAINSAGEYIHGEFPEGFWGSATDPIKEADFAAPIVVPEIEYTLEFLSPIPQKLWVARYMPDLRIYLGRVNDRVDIYLYNAPQETLMLSGWEAEEQQRNKRDVNLTVKVWEKNRKFFDPALVGPDSDGLVQVTHNMFWRPGIGWIDVHAKHGQKVYSTANISHLWNPSVA